MVIFHVHIHTFKAQNIDYHMMKACLVACHGPFTWGKDAEEAIFVSVMLEEIAMQNYMIISQKLTI
jgi:L-ribulose-5-phosphate 4-epimerase